MEIYLDNAASARPLENLGLETQFGNPNSTHKIGRRLKSKLEEAREKLATYFSTNPHGVIFTATATEANNLYVNSFDEVYCSHSEHSSVFNLPNTKKAIAMSSLGEIKFDAQQKEFQGTELKFVSLIQTNNETGVFFDYKQLSVDPEVNTIVHLDCAQSANWYDLKDVLQYADAITLSSHKCGGPFGASALVLSEKFLKKKLLKAQTLGGGQEYQLRAGTQNVSASVGFVDAFLHSQTNRHKTLELARIQEQLALDLLNDSGLDYEYLCSRINKTPAIMSIWFKGCQAQELQTLLDLNDVCISLGSACKSGAVAESETFKAIGLPAQTSKETIRVSFGWNTTVDEVKFGIEKIIKTVKELL